MLHGTELPLYQNLVYWLSPTATLEQCLRAIWDAASWASVLILPQIKLNTELSSCASFLVSMVKVVWYSHFFKNIPQFVVIHTVKVFNKVSEAKVDVFLEFFCFFYDPTNVGSLISGSSAFSKSSLNIWEFSIHILLKPHLENFEHYFASVWDECNCAVVWAFFGIAFLWGWNENWPFLVLWPLLSFPNLLAYWVQHFQNIIF